MITRCSIAFCSRKSGCAASKWKRQHDLSATGILPHLAFQCLPCFFNSSWCPRPRSSRILRTPFISQTGPLFGRRNISLLFGLAIIEPMKNLGSILSQKPAWCNNDIFYSIDHFLVHVESCNNLCIFCISIMVAWLTKDKEGSTIRVQLFKQGYRVIYELLFKSLEVQYPSWLTPTKNSSGDFQLFMRIAPR